MNLNHKMKLPYKVHRCSYLAVATLLYNSKNCLGTPCTWNIRCLVDETIDLTTQRIILKIVGFLNHKTKLHNQNYSTTKYTAVAIWP